MPVRPVRTIAVVASLSLIGFGATTSVRAARRPVRCFGLVATIVGDGEGNVLQGTEGDDVINAKGGDDKILAGGGDDVICGGKGRDVIDAADGNDVLLGGADPDALQAGSGDDLLRGQGGDDTIDGREGDLDVVDYSVSAVPIQANMESNRITGQGTDSVFEVEVVFGSEFDDVITASGAGNSLFGGGGNDHLNGSVADDIARRRRIERHRGGGRLRHRRLLVLKRWE